MNDDRVDQLEQTLDTVAKTHRHDFVIDTAAKILALDPTRALAHYHLIMAYYYMNKFDDMHEAILAAAPYVAHLSWFHYAWYLYYLYLGGTEYIKAKEHIEQAIAIDPSIAHYFRSLGELYLINREADKAAGALGEAVRLDPSNPEYRSRYALALLRQHKLRESLTTADQALKDGISEARIYDTVGMIYTLAGELDKGEELFREALRRMPTYDYFQKHIDWVLREKKDRAMREEQGKPYTPLYLRHTGTRLHF